MAYLTSYDSRQLRTVLGTFTTGVTVVTTRDPNGKLHGVTANSFSSVSLEPPLVLWSQALTSKSYEAFRDANYFSINILADDQIDVSKHFAKSQDDKFANIDFIEGLGGVPVLKGTVAHLECAKEAAYPAGDHVIYIGRVDRVGHSGRRPLAFAHGRYMIPYAHDLGLLSLPMPGAAVAAVEAIRLGAEALPRIQQATGGHTLCLAVWGNHGPTVICWEQGQHAWTSQLRSGLVLSTTQTATGRAFAAFMPREVTRAFVDEDLRLYRIADEGELDQRQRFEDEIAITTATGIACVVDREPSPLNDVPLTAFSVPIFDSNDGMVMTLSLAAEASRIDPRRDCPVAQALCQAGRELSGLIAEQTGTKGRSTITTVPYRCAALTKS